MVKLKDEQVLSALLIDAWKDNHDPSHDLDHVHRVVRMAKYIASHENARLEIILPAAWLHDCVNLPKDHPDRKMASRFAADYAVKALEPFEPSADILHQIRHAIEAHSFSSGIQPETIEAKIVQDADRLDSLGAIGIARTFAVSGILGRPLWNSVDPLAENRIPDDGLYGLDHFYIKLFEIAKTLHTEAAKKVALERVSFMKQFAEEIRKEVQFKSMDH